MIRIVSIFRKSHLPRRMTVATGFVLALMSSGGANAQAWSTTLEIIVQSQYNDNARLEVDDALQNEIYGADLDASVRFLRRSPTGSVVFRPRISTSYFPDDRDDDSNDVFALFRAEHRTQRSVWSFRTRYSDEQVRSAEIENTDFDDPDIDRPIADDTGIIQVKNRRNRLVVSPGIQFQISERNWFEIVGDCDVSSYDEQLNELRDSQYGNVELNFRRGLSPKSFVTFRAFGASYDSDDNDFASDSTGLGAQLNYDISERNSFFILAGLMQVDFDFADNGVLISESEDAFVGGMGLTRDFEVSRLVLDIRHTVDPAGGKSVNGTYAVSCANESPAIATGNRPRVLPYPDYQFDSRIDLDA